MTEHLASKSFLNNIITIFRDPATGPSARPFITPFNGAGKTENFGGQPKKLWYTPPRSFHKVI